MNKQLTKKAIGIAASAALLASVAFSGSALAAPPDKDGGPPQKNNDVAKGTKTSIDVYSNCNIVDRDLVVNVTITDKNDYPGSTKTLATLESVTVQALEKTGPRSYNDVPVAWDNTLDKCDGGDDIGFTTTCTITLVDVCDMLSADAKSLDALTTVSTGDNGNLVNYYSQCKDSDLKLEDGAC